MKRILFSLVYIFLVSACFAGADLSEKNAQLIQAAKDGNLPAVQTALAEGADIKIKDDYGFTPLHWAVSNGHKKLSELFITKGAEVDAKTNNGFTPLHIAADAGHKDTAALLITKGVDVNAQAKDGTAPLHRAAIKGHRDMAEFLIIKGAKINAKTKDGATALNIAAENGHKDMVELLLTKGADINIKADNGSTPLHSAAVNGHSQTAEFLIVNGADVNAKENLGGFTALHFTAMKGDKHLAELLITKGANVNAKSNDGSTPVYYAEQFGNKDIADLLRKHGAKESESVVSQNSDKSDKSARNASEKPASKKSSEPVSEDLQKNSYNGPVKVRLQTNVGDIIVEIDVNMAPVTAKNFLRYVEEDFFNGTIFHRVIPNFMIQGGGFTADMKQKQTHEPIINEASNGLKNNRGTISMARTNNPNSATCQFFINLKNNDFLNYSGPKNPGYAVFGKVVEGMDVVDKIAAVATTTKNNMADVPVKPITIKSAMVITGK